VKDIKMVQPIDPRNAISVMLTAGSMASWGDSRLHLSLMFFPFLVAGLSPFAEQGLPFLQQLLHFFADLYYR